MPGYSAKCDALATKLVSFYPLNAGTGVPTHNAVILLFEASRGTVKAVRFLQNTSRAYCH